MAEGGDSHIDMHPKRPHEAPYSPHQTENWHIPHIVEHARAVRGQAVGVEPEIPAAVLMNSIT